MPEHHEPHLVVTSAYEFYSHTVAIQQYVRTFFQINLCIKCP